MTTNIKITVNGAYVAEGGYKVSGEELQTFKIGPGSNVEHNIGVRMGQTCELDITEREATADEIREAKAGRDNADPQAQVGRETERQQDEQ